MESSLSEKLEDRHRISVMAQVMVRCRCGWKHRPEKIRGVPQEKIDMELLHEFEMHLDDMRKK